MSIKPGKRKRNAGKEFEAWASWIEMILNPVYCARKAEKLHLNQRGEPLMATAFVPYRP